MKIISGLYCNVEDNGYLSRTYPNYACLKWRSIFRIILRVSSSVDIPCVYIPVVTQNFRIKQSRIFSWDSVRSAHLSLRLIPTNELYPPTLDARSNGNGQTSFFGTKRLFKCLTLYQAEEALAAAEVPVGCVFVRGEKVIAKARNRTNQLRNVWI